MLNLIYPYKLHSSKGKTYYVTANQAYVYVRQEQ